MITTHTPDLAGDLAQRTAAGADDALLATRRAAGDAAYQVETGIDHLRQTVPPALSRATARAEDLARGGIDRARQATTAVREKAVQVGDQTVDYIQHKPVKAMLVAAAAGAVVAVLAGWMTRSRSSRA